MILETHLSINRPRDEVFAFFSNAENLERLTPSELRFEILTPTPIPMRAGQIIDYRIRLFRFPLRWRTEITLWAPPFEFIDVQRRGPYAEWIHHHLFTEENGGTRITDRVRYRLPLGGLGRVAHPWVRRELHRIFDYRQNAVRAYFAEGGKEVS